MTPAQHPVRTAQGGFPPPSGLRPFTPREYLENSEAGRAAFFASSSFPKYSRGGEAPQGRGGAGSPPCGGGRRRNLGAAARRPRLPAALVAVIGAICLTAATARAEAPRFEDAAGALPEAHVYAGGWAHFVGGGVAAFDCDGDGRPELAVAGGENPARLFLNRSAPGRIAFVAGALPALDAVTGLWPLDIDGDGHLDLAVLRVGPNVLLRGLGGCRFEPADWDFAPGDAWSTAFAATWEEDAAFPTLAIGNYVDRARPDGPFFACDANELHRPGAGGYGAPLRLEPGFCALSMLISDWARTGRPELRVSNDRHYYVRGGYEQMWRLDTLTERVGAGDWPRISLWGMGIASRDLTGDGLPEVFLTSMADQLLQFNTGAGFENAPYSIGTYAQVPHAGDDGRPTTGWHAEFGDIDNDGLPDLFIAKGNVDQMPSNAIHDPNNLLMQTPDGTFREASVAAGVATMERARGAALVDLDGDGRLDIVVVNRRAPMEVWRNVTPGTGAWVQVEPRMDGPNTRAVGAWVEVRAGGHVQAQEVTVGGGHGGGQAGPLHFGLGAATTADMRVIWPGGAASDWAPLPLNRRVTVRPDGAALAIE